MTARQKAEQYLTDRGYYDAYEEVEPVERVIEDLHETWEQMIEDNPTPTREKVLELIDLAYDIGVAEGLLHRYYQNETWEEL